MLLAVSPAIATDEVNVAPGLGEDHPGQGPWFAGARVLLADAAFAPALRYFDVFEHISEFGFFDGLVKVAAWRAALAERASVRAAVAPDYADRLAAFLRQRGGALARRMAQAT